MSSRPKIKFFSQCANKNWTQQAGPLPKDYRLAKTSDDRHPHFLHQLFLQTLCSVHNCDLINKIRSILNFSFGWYPKDIMSLRTNALAAISASAASNFPGLNLSKLLVKGEQSLGLGLSRVIQLQLGLVRIHLHIHIGMGAVNAFHFFYFLPIELGQLWQTGGLNSLFGKLNAIHTALHFVSEFCEHLHMALNRMNNKNTFFIINFLTIIWDGMSIFVSLTEKFCSVATLASAGATCCISFNFSKLSA
ncbi:hypothetical protein BpHYR1_003562 [Brachionus plicatilis]|uniref:Uncharacterized protein n=1 Tax=Brachionus plicatilis TaxID=10195 RepID=A0A3M7QEK2_BRAPC|nr:hypothetical protein BpHYR1_003562 [Brachionus plicatilis]